MSHAATTLDLLDRARESLSNGYAASAASVRYLAASLADYGPGPRSSPPAPDEVARAVGDGGRPGAVGAADDDGVVVTTGHEAPPVGRTASPTGFSRRSRRATGRVS